MFGTGRPAYRSCSICGEVLLYRPGVGIVHCDNCDMLLSMRLTLPPPEEPEPKKKPKP